MLPQFNYKLEGERVTGLLYNSDSKFCKPKPVVLVIVNSIRIHQVNFQGAFPDKFIYKRKVVLNWD